MSDQHREASASVEPYFDRTPQPFGDGPVGPLVYDASPRALRQRTMNFAAKRLVDMRYVSRLDRTPPPSGISAATGHSAGRPRLPSRARRSRWDHKFESVFLQRRVCEPPVPLQG